MKISEVRFIQAVDFGIKGGGTLNSISDKKAAFNDSPNGVLITVGEVVRLVPWSNIRACSVIAEPKK